MTEISDQQANLTRYHGQPRGHYESFFVRANHPSRPLAFWIRYTLFSPRGQPQQAVGELWAIFFNGETGRQVAVKQEFPLAECVFDPAAFRVQVGAARLGPGALVGDCAGQGHHLTWTLEFAGGARPLFLLPRNLYDGGFPAAKSLVAQPLARFNGTLVVDGETIAVQDWLGSQNHNWGSRHTDRYAWGQVAGFDGQPEAFLEVATAILKLGPLWLPPITLLALRLPGREYLLTRLLQGVRARGKFGYFTWDFRSATPEVEITGLISAPREAFVGLRYTNPPGGSKYCLNTKLAACALQVRDRRTGAEQRLATQHRAAFEILTDDSAHGIAVSA